MEQQEKKIVAREYLSVTKCRIDDEDFWTATNEIHDKVQYEGETEFVDEMINGMSIDRDCQAAIQTAMSASLNYLLQNVYQNGFNGLVEFRAYERQLKAAQDAKSDSI